MKYLFFSLRPKHWIKNLFIFLPLIFAGKLILFPASLKTAITFCLFSLGASTAYLINDIIDLKIDRFHPTKRLRPIACGKVTLKQASIAVIVLGILSISLSFILDVGLGYILIIYLALNFIYSKYLKDKVIIDVFCIAIFFLLRILSGSIAAGVNPSYWIIIITVLLALFLGFNKRRQELKLFGHNAARYRHVLNKYNIRFIDRIITVITLLLLTTYALYTVSLRTTAVFGTKNLIYTIPFVYYGIFRYLYLIHKIKNDGDPTRVLLSDRKLQLNITLWIIVCILVIYSCSH